MLRKINGLPDHANVRQVFLVIGQVSRSSQSWGSCRGILNLNSGFTHHESLSDLLVFTLCGTLPMQFNASTLSIPATPPNKFNLRKGVLPWGRKTTRGRLVVVRGS